MEINKSSTFFKQLLVNPDLADYDVLNKLITKYPYISAFWFIKARKAVLHNEDNAVLYFQQAALLSPKSELLYQFVHPRKALAPATSPLQDESLIKESEPAQTISAAESSQVASRYHDDSMPYSFLWWLNKTRKEHGTDYQPYAKQNDTPPVEKINTKSDPLDQQVREHIFHIQSPELKLSEGKSTETIPFKVHKKENSIIEKFIKEEPQITPPSPEKVSSENKARESAIDESGFVSETLAKIYTEQGLHHKAIETYKKLSLKFPEKSPYFADLIKQLEKQN